MEKIPVEVLKEEWRDIPSADDRVFFNGCNLKKGDFVSPSPVLPFECSTAVLPLLLPLLPLVPRAAVTTPRAENSFPKKKEKKKRGVDTFWISTIAIAIYMGSKQSTKSNDNRTCQNIGRCSTSVKDNVNHIRSSKSMGTFVLLSQLNQHGSNFWIRQHFHGSSQTSTFPCIFRGGGGRQCLNCSSIGLPCVLNVFGTRRFQ